MPAIAVPATADLIALYSVAEQAGLAVEYHGSVRNAIDTVAAAGGVSLDYAGSDRNAIELLAGLLGGGAPYVLRLDDDGTHAATLGMLHLPTAPPDYLTASHEFGSAIGKQKFLAMPASVDGAVSVGGPVHAFQVDIVGMPGWNEEVGGAGWQVVAAGAVSLLRDGVMVGGYDAGLYVRSWTPGAGKVSLELYDYAEPDLPVWAVDLPDFEAGSTVKVGIYIDTESGRVGCTMNGTDYGYITESVGEVTHFMPALYAEQSGEVPDEISVSVTLNMQPTAQEITEPVPAGALDCYGVAV